MASAEQSHVFYNGKSKFENISGQFRPDKSSLFERIVTPRSSEIDDSYWTDQTIATVTEVMQAMHTEFASYGVPPTAAFDRNQFRVLDDKKVRRGFSGHYYNHSGLVFLSKNIWKYLEKREDPFVSNYARENLAHEYAHTLSARVLRNGRIRRQGIEIFLNGRNETKAGLDLGSLGFLVRPAFKAFIRSDGVPIGFDKFSEGVVDKTVLMVVKKYFPIPLKVSRSSSYDRYVQLIDLVCRRISDTNPRYGTPEDVYCLFEQAEFGDGKLLPLARAIESTYGRDSFTQIMTAIEELPRFNEGKFYKYEEFHTVLEGKFPLHEYVGRIKFKL